jgi:hypothetical protein
MARRRSAAGMSPRQREPALDARRLPVVRLAGRDVELTCICGLTLTQPLRAAIAERCAKCGRYWR